MRESLVGLVVFMAVLYLGVEGLSSGLEASRGNHAQEIAGFGARDVALPHGVRLRRAGEIHDADEISGVDPVLPQGLDEIPADRVEPVAVMKIQYGSQGFGGNRRGLCLFYPFDPS